MNKIQKKMFKIGVIIGIIGLIGCIISKQLEYDYLILDTSLGVWFSRILGGGLGISIYYITLYNIIEKKYDDAN